jgi:hypothetical protein
MMGKSNMYFNFKLYWLLIDGPQLYSWYDSCRIFFFFFLFSFFVSNSCRIGWTMINKDCPWSIYIIKAAALLFPIFPILTSLGGWACVGQPFLVWPPQTPVFVCFCTTHLPFQSSSRYYGISMDTNLLYINL